MEAHIKGGELMDPEILGGKYLLWVICHQSLLFVFLFHATYSRYLSDVDVARPCNYLSFLINPLRFRLICFSHSSGEFETLLLDNTGKIEGVSFDQAMDYDDEVDGEGNIDLGEIASQYLCMEII